MTRPDVLVLQPTLPAEMHRLKELTVLHRLDLATDRNAFLRSVGDRIRGIIVNGHTPIDEQLLDALPRLEIICSSAAGYEAIDLPAVHRRGVRLTNTSIALADDVADAAILLTLAARRNLVRAHEHVRTGAWAQEGMFLLQSSFKGKKLGIVGMGGIGQAILKRAVAFGTELAYHARNSRLVAARYEPDLERLAAWADILITIVPGGAATHHMIDAPILHALGPTGTLVNVARGSVVDEAALIEALSDGTLGSAALDVFATEPQVNSRLAALSNVTLMPHHASGTVETRAAMARLMVDNLLAHFEGRPLISPVPTASAADWLKPT